MQLKSQYLVLVSLYRMWNKANGSDGIPVEVYKILKDDAVKVLHSVCQQIWKTQQWIDTFERIDAFKMWCWRRLLRVPWTARRSNQLIVKEISPEYLLEGLMLKLKLQYFGHLMWRANLLEKNLMLGNIEGRMRRGRQRMRWLDGITDSLDFSLSNSGSWWWTGKPGMLQYMGSKKVRHDWATELNWTEL